MKRHGNLWDKIIDPENIKSAYKKARRCRSKFESVQKFEKNEEANLKAIREALVNKTFKTSRYTTKIIYEPKKRTIYILPFAPDRIVQHALVNIIEPIFEKTFIDDSFACRKGKGQHSGSTRTKEFVRRNKYCLKGDIRHFYPSINHDILMSLLERKIKCKNTLWLLRDIVYSFPGETNSPIGNLTSQLFGNLYMNELDKFVKHELRIKDYIRYCDDFCLFHDDKEFLKDAAKKIEMFLAERLKLTLSKCDLFQTSRGVDFLGYRHFPDYTLLRKSTAKRVKRRLKKLPGQLANKEISLETYCSSIASTYGWLKWADTYNLMTLIKLDELLQDAKQKQKEVNMRGFPKELNTKQDYLNCIEKYPNETRQALQTLLDSRFSWFRVRELDDGEEAPEGDNYRVVEEKDGMDPEAETKRILEELREDPNALLFLRGFTVEEVQELINPVT